MARRKQGIQVYEATKEELDKLRSTLHLQENKKLTNPDLIELLLEEYKKLKSDGKKK